MDTTRASLLVRIRNPKDAAAWRRFDQIYRPMLHRFAIARSLGHADAEDVVQHCMAAIHQHIDSFDYDPEKGRFKAWLRTLVNNRIRTLRRGPRDVQAPSAAFRNIPAAEAGPEADFDRMWMQEHLWHCLRELQTEVEEATFRAFQSYVIEQRPADEVCQEMNMTRNHLYTIKWRLTEKVSAKMAELLDDAD